MLKGGGVNRYKEKYGFIKIPTPREMARAGTTEIHAGKIADQMVATGVTVNFAPSVDLDYGKDSAAIGRFERSFSDDPSVVVENARKFCQQHFDRGLTCVLKHFPGHGSARGDTHEGLVDITNDYDQKELEPYKKLIEGGRVDSVMIAHVYNRSLDPDNPATMSSSIINGLLRLDLGFKGVVISDDMQMGAIVDSDGHATGLEKERNLLEAVVKSINAGIDMVLIGNNFEYDQDIAEKVMGHVGKQVAKGAISRGRIEESFKRIQEWKSKIQPVSKSKSALF